MSENSTVTEMKTESVGDFLHRDIRPDLANLCRDTLADPFYRDDRIPTFVTWLYLVWNTPPEEVKSTVPIPVCILENLSYED